MRVGIVGAGAMGEVHAAGWRAAGADLVGVVAEERSSAVDVAGRYGAEAFREVDDLLSAVDLVDLCVPTDLHHPMTLQAAAAGVNVMCEKPIALNLADGYEMIEACSQAGVRLFIAMVLRFFPQYAAAAELVHGGAIGKPGVLRLKRVSYQPGAGESSWYRDVRRSGGMLLDLMIHDFDYARALAGEVERVYARGGGAGPDGEPTYALVTLRFRSGAMALLEGGWAYPPGHFRTGFDLAGSEGLIEWDSDSSEPVQRFLAAGPGGSARVGLPLSLLSEDPYTTEIKHVHAALQSGEPFALTPNDALEALRLALAARQSLKSGRAIDPREVQ